MNKLLNMYIRRLTLENVGRFKSATLELNRGFNLLIGENGTGKTTILRSILAATGSRKHQTTGPLRLQPNDVHTEKKELQVTVEIATENEYSRRLTYNQNIVGNPRRTGKKSDIILLHYRTNESLSGNLRPKRKSRTRVAEAESTDEVEEFIFQTQTASNLDIKPEQRFGRSKEISQFVKSALRKLSPNFRSFSWRFEAVRCEMLSSEKNNFPEEPIADQEHAYREISNVVLQSLMRYPNKLANVDQRKIRVDSNGYVIGAEKQTPLFPPVEELIYEFSESPTSIAGYVGPSVTFEIELAPRIVVTTATGDLPLSQLSDGEKRVFSMLVDIARILSLSSEREIERSEAIVLIDEIDLHLHPKWQRSIAPNLEDLFPACQFVATTHSPFVIQSVDSQKVQKVTPEGATAIGSIMSDSIEDIVELIQGVEIPQRSLRHEKLHNAASRYFKLLEQGKVDPEILSAAEAEYRVASEPFSSNQALNAFLQIQKTRAEKA